MTALFAARDAVLAVVVERFIEQFDFASLAPAAAYTTPAVGGTVFNPLTRANETVVEVVGTYAVRSSANNIIFLPDAVGDTYSVSTTSATGVVTTTPYKSVITVPLRLIGANPPALPAMSGRASTRARGPAGWISSSATATRFRSTLAIAASSASR